MANLLNINGRGKYFFVIQYIYTFHAIILLTFLNGLVIKPPHHNKTITSHSIRYTYLSKILNKNIAWEKATYSFQFLLNHLFFNRVNEMHLIWLQHQQIWY